jgi:pimeloyl-ACP methyl ester carboxylesterase
LKNIELGYGHGTFSMNRIFAAVFAVALPIVALTSATELTAATQAFTGFHLLEKPGPYGVGLRIVEQVDDSRSFQAPADNPGKSNSGVQARPLQTLVWYPAARGGAKPVKYRDYVSLEETETSFGHPHPPDDVEARKLASIPKSTRSQAMWAVRDAKLLPGTFPVIIYAASFSSVSWENVDLCEYLASHGYVVIAAPGMGVHRKSTHDVAGTNAQASDISFLIDFAKSLPDADLSRVAAVGFSWGAIANLFAAARDDRIHALVAMDGSMRYYPGVVKDAGDIHPEKLRIPLLFFTSHISIEDQDAMVEQMKDPGPSVLNAWKAGDLFKVDMLGMVHPQFSSKGQRQDRFWTTGEFAAMQQADYDRQDGVIGYGWVARYTREFLDAFLKQDSAAKDFLKRTPAQNGVPAHMMGARFRPGRDTNP